MDDRVNFSISMSLIRVFNSSLPISPFLKYIMMFISSDLLIDSPCYLFSLGVKRSGL